jgi:hypothetical protein
MQKYVVALLLSSIGILATAAGVPAKPELVGISLGATWANTAVAIGAESVRCVRDTGRPEMDTMCTFKLRKGATWAGLPLQSDAAVGLLEDKVVYVATALPALDAAGEAKLEATFKQLASAWKMTKTDGDGELALVSADLKKRPANKAQADAAMSSTSLLAKVEDDQSVTLFLGSLLMMVQMSEEPGA